MKEFVIELNDKLGGVIRYPEKWSQADVINWTVFALTRLAVKGKQGKRREERMRALEQAAKSALITIENAREIERFKRGIDGD